MTKTTQISEEEAYLKDYDATRYQRPNVSVDSVLFTCHKNTLQVLLAKRDSPVQRGHWGLPGGFIDPAADNTLEQCAIRKLKEKTNVTPPYMEQLYSVGNNKRDPRNWSISICYFSLIAYQDCTPGITSVSDAAWFPVENLDKVDLAFDHYEIITTARERIRQKALYSVVPGYALPKEFSLTELQQLYEIIIGKKLGKASFRRRIEQVDILEHTGSKKLDAGRPTAIYQMKPWAKEFNFIRNIEE
ncbi:NUDIX hydrolase [Zhongshania borealis]|uniref:NUDIX domain-containing protein n=1 Tax=Zhongshania borealis TaxID=889488 RepID=A0ABP7W662_9GAMM